jgi:2,3-bisphosphoglycerate-dependent phosphoglycerate mutase
MASPTRAYAQHTYEPPPGACQILLVRHGQSQAFVPGQPFALVAGQGDPPLSELGRAQARAVAERLRSEPIAAVYVSTLQRTAQTAEPLLDALGLEARVDPDLREVHLGEGEGGRFRQMVAEGHPAAVAMRARLEWGEIPGAETNAQLTARTVGVVERIASAHPDEVVAAFCHGGVIGAILGHLARANPFLFNRSDNAGISHIVVGGGEATIRRYNDSGHLGQLTVPGELPT